MQLTEAVFSRNGKVGSEGKENAQILLRGERNMSKGKSVSFASKKGLREPEKLL